MQQAFRRIFSANKVSVANVALLFFDMMSSERTTATLHFADEGIRARES
jgi:hypothetical protein